MKIGILAFQQAINYGAALQLYALQQTVKNIVGGDSTVELIDYQQPKLTKKHKLIINSNNIIKGIVNNLIFLPSRFIHIKKFKNFYDKYTNLTVKVNKLSQLPYFDIAIVGSDQVWNTEIHNYDSSFLFNNLKCGKKISYAASVGKNKLNEKDKKYFMDNLSLFDALALREKSSVELLTEFTEKEITVTLDPTLLLSAEEWKDIAKKPKIQEKYILVYTMEINKELEEIVEKVSKEFGLPLKFVKARSNSLKEKFSLKYSLGPEEFLGLIANSEFIITNSFHGTCFSIIFDKNFITVPHKTRGSRMIDLLEDLNLEDRIIRQSNELDPSKLIISQEKHKEKNSLLKQYKNKSIEYLKKNLK